MQKTMETVALWTGRLARLALWAAGTGLILMTALIAAQVFWRYVLNDSIVWTEPASVMIMGWFIFLGAAVGIREGYHLSFDVVLYVLPHGAKMAKTAGNMLPSLGISGAYDFAPIVAGGLLIALFSVERVFRRAAGLPTARFGDDAEAA